MAKTYKVWVQIETVDEENDVYTNEEEIDIAEFDTMKKAKNFFDKLLEVKP